MGKIKSKKNNKNLPTNPSINKPAIKKLGNKNK